MAVRGKVEEELVPKGVYIITTRSDGQRAGMTASWVCRVAGKPPIMMTAIHHRSHTGELIRQKGMFLINIIDRNQIEIARLFGLSSGHRIDKFKGLACIESGQGLPVMPDCLGYLECKVREHIVVADHTVFLGEIIEEKRFRSGSPLMFSPADFRARKGTK